MRPNIVGLVDTVALRAALAAVPTTPDKATAPAPTPARLRKVPRL
jgi:hypothetical protein